MFNYYFSVKIGKTPKLQGDGMHILSGIITVIPSCPVVIPVSVLNSVLLSFCLCLLLWTEANCNVNFFTQEFEYTCILWD